MHGQLSWNRCASPATRGSRKEDRLRRGQGFRETRELVSGCEAHGEHGISPNGCTCRPSWHRASGHAWTSFTASKKEDTAKKREQPLRSQIARILNGQKAAENETPPKEIQALRNALEAALRELKVTLVVLVNDLDRCLPETAISTLEAIRLLLFMDYTAFVIAATNP